MVAGLSSGVLQGDTVLSLGRSSGAAGGTVEMPVGFASDDGVVGVQIDFGYNPEVLTPQAAQVGLDLDTRYRVASSVIEPGVYRVLLYSLRNDFIADGSILAVPLQFTQTLPGSERGLEVLRVELADAGGLNRRYALAPFVEIVSPARGSQVPLGEGVTVEVDAYAAAGSLAGVQLFINGQLVEEKAQGPYAFSWNPAERGTHDLLVVASDAGDIQSQSSRALYILSRFDDWISENFSEEDAADRFVSGFDADPDGDGSVNGIEYLTNGNPLGGDLGPPLKTELAEIDGQLYLTVTIEVPVEVTDISYTVYGVGQLDRAAGEAPAEAVLHAETLGNGVIRRVYRDVVPFEEQPRYMFIETSIRP